MPEYTSQLYIHLSNYPILSYSYVNLSMHLFIHSCLYKPLYRAGNAPLYLNIHSSIHALSTNITIYLFVLLLILHWVNCCVPAMLSICATTLLSIYLLTYILSSFYPNLYRTLYIFNLKHLQSFLSNEKLKGLNNFLNRQERFSILKISITHSLYISVYLF